MKVFIIRTPEFSSEKLNEIVMVLTSVPGDINFSRGEDFTHTQIVRANRTFEDASQISSLSFQEYIDIINEYRYANHKDVKEDDFVILISSIRNNKNWFSAFNKRNIFIHGVEWDLISNVDAKYGIAYQCVENIFQSLIDLDIVNYSQEPNIHMKAIGCINDFCQYKPEILIKLQSANICPSCIERSVKKGVSDLVMTHIVAIMEEIRKEFVISKKFSKEANLSKVKIDPQGNVTIGDKPIKLNTLPKVMYICFLRNIDGIPTNEVCKNENQFEKIYRLIKTNPDEYAVRKMCCSTIKYPYKTERIKPTFETYRSKIKMVLVQQLGQTLSNFYHVNLVENKDNQNIFKINLTRDYLDINPKFLK